MNRLLCETNESESSYIEYITNIPKYHLNTGPSKQWQSYMDFCYGYNWESIASYINCEETLKLLYCLLEEAVSSNFDLKEVNCFKIKQKIPRKARRLSKWKNKQIGITAKSRILSKLIDKFKVVENDILLSKDIFRMSEEKEVINKIKSGSSLFYKYVVKKTSKITYIGLRLDSDVQNGILNGS